LLEYFSIKGPINTTPDKLLELDSETSSDQEENEARIR
jgi:hypothetical protein